MEVHKITLYVVDHDSLGADEVADVLQNQRYQNDCIYPHIISVQSADAGEWDDDHPLNRSSTAAAEIEKLFQPPPVHQEEEK